MDSTRAVQLQRQSGIFAALSTPIARPRLAVYLACCLVAVLGSVLLGKDMMWDTLDYHLYAGFSALHERIGRDYFAAGSQSYFNPYVYVPFYLLATSRVPALAAACILAALQSGILCLSYELALAVVPGATERGRMALGVCAVLLVLANPILINQLGTSSADVITAELVLAAWVLLARAITLPSHTRLISAGLLLGVASALKLTNAVHAFSACVMLLFLPLTWRLRLRYAVSCGLALVAGFLLVAAPWSLHLERHFGNPVFPLLNGVFRSPQFPTSSFEDLRFVPNGLGEALSRPFAIALPLSMVDDEFAAPDLRYALLAILAIVAFLRWARGRPQSPNRSAIVGAVTSPRVLMALGSAFLLDWVLWLMASGNGRYFIAMACVAAVLAVALLFRLLAARPKLRNYLVVAIFAAQGLEVCAGATYREHVPWDGGPWLEVSVPQALAAQPDLYFDFEQQSNSFVIPFLASGSGFINLDGDYVLGSGGANGRHVQWLIRKYSPRLRTLVLQPSADELGAAGPWDLSHENDMLAHFGLRVDAGDCERIRIRDAQASSTTALQNGPQGSGADAGSHVARVAQPTDAFLMTCRVVASSGSEPSLLAEESRANLVFDRLEHACPSLFQPAGSVTLDFGDARQGYSWVRRYGNTGLSTVITGGVVEFIDPLRGGAPVHLGRETDWEKSPLTLSCGRRGQRYYAVAH